MTKTSGNLQNELNQRDQEIAKLNRRILELEKDLAKVKQEKDDEANRFN